MHPPVISAQEPFTTYSGYLRKRYGSKVYRVSVDGGFSCPNRGDDRMNRGCTFCALHGSRAAYLRSKREEDDPGDRFAHLRSQIEEGLSFLTHRYRAAEFILYFQAFSGTHGPVETLKRVYDFGLSLYPFRELIVSTRPDCLGEDVANLLGTYREKVEDVWVELGLQSIHDKTLKRIRRGHDFSQFVKTFDLLRSVGIKVAVHLIIGLPGENGDQIMETAREVAGMDPDGIKIHNLHVSKDTALAGEYLRGELSVPVAHRHINYVIQVLEVLPTHTPVMRITCDTPDRERLAPKREMPKQALFESLRSEMRRLETWQGRLNARASLQSTSFSAAL